jgi:hypothetical protein
MGEAPLEPSPSLSDDPLPPASEARKPRAAPALEAAANEAWPELGREGYASCGGTEDTVRMARSGNGMFLRTRAAGSRAPLSCTAESPGAEREAGWGTRLRG